MKTIVIHCAGNATSEAIQAAMPAATVLDALSPESRILINAAPVSNLPAIVFQQDNGGVLAIYQGEELDLVGAQSFLAAPWPTTNAPSTAIEGVTQTIAVTHPDDTFTGSIVATLDGVALVSVTMSQGKGSFSLTIANAALHHLAIGTAPAIAIQGIVPPPIHVPPPDLAGLQVAIHQSAEFTVALVVDLYGNPNGSALFQLAQVAAMIGDWTHVQTVYNNLKAAPPTGWTAANVTDLGNLAVAHHIPITP